MKLTRTWIDSHLSAKERTLLVEWLLERSQNPTGEQILAGLRELFPALDEELPSLNSVLEWKRKVWAFELHRRELRADTAAARMIAGDTDHTVGEANKRLVDAYVFEQLRSLREGAEVDGPALHDWILAAARLSKTTFDAKRLQEAIESERVRRKTAEIKLEKLEAEATELRAKAEAAKAAIGNAKKRGITEESMREIEEAIGLL